MPIYTREGDKGLTSLIGGKRVGKASQIMEAIGAVDELNATIGVLRTQKTAKKTDKILRRIQADIFTIGAQLADPQNKLSLACINKNRIKFLEQGIDKIEAKLPKLTRFIIPNGLPFSAYAHLCRTICRRAERRIAALSKKQKTNMLIIAYLNRLSDLFFMLAREHMHAKGREYTIWNPKL